ncbi:MAG: hypothetical protein JNK82_23695 [Myxococcaceae bacterium]|nr:hypothetical protein [Myxococcaceae bacterium]
MRNALIVFAVVAAACGVSNESTVEQDDLNDTLAEGAELSATSRTFVGVRRDYRKCIAPLCGGYWVHDLNRVNLNEVYVSGLDFTGSNLSDEDQGRIAGGEEVVLRGKLGPKESTFNTRPFIVSEAYRGLPGKPLGTADAFVKIEEVNIQCFRAPCATLGARRVNYTAQILFHGLDLAAPTAGLVSGNWLDKRATEDGAITSGTWVKQGEEKIFAATNVFFKLPEVAGPCPLFRPTNCADGQTWGYRRDADRCVVPVSCVPQRFCAAVVPACADGYTLTSWPSTNGGCPAYACDPSWVVDAN